MKKSEVYFEGIKKALPLCIGVVAIGMSFGLTAVESGLNGWQATAMSLFVLAGSSQIMAVSMFASGTSAAAVAFAVFLINLRHIVMSSYVMNRLNKYRLGEKLLLALAVCDESFALFSMRRETERDDIYLFGLETALASSWVLSTALGCVISGVLPEIISKSLGIAFYAAFISMLVPNMKKSLRLTAVIALTAGINFVLTRFMDAGLAVISSMLLGAFAGMYIMRGEEV